VVVDMNVIASRSYRKWTGDTGGDAAPPVRV